MKKITQLNEKIKNIEGEVMQEGYDRRRVIIDSLGALGDVSGDEKIRAYSLALKIKDHKKDVMEIEDQDFGLLKKAIEKRGLVAQVHAPIMQSLEQENKDGETEEEK